MDLPTTRLPVIHAPLVRSADDLSRVPLGTLGRGTLAIGDVADVVESHAVPIGDALVTTGTGLLLIVEKQPGASTLEVTNAIDRTLKRLRPALTGVEMDSSIFRPASFIERALSNLGHAMSIGCGLVIVVLFLFLWNLRTALISVLAIPLSLLAATFVLTALGRTIDTMVIAGLVIALGEVVDDAIIDVENIHRRLRTLTTPPDLKTALRVVLDASLEVRSAIVYASLIVLLVFVPILFLGGVAGEFFRPLALAYGLAVFASTLVALTITPALALLLLRRDHGAERPLADRRGAHPRVRAAAPPRREATEAADGRDRGAPGGGGARGRDAPRRVLAALRGERLLDALDRAPGDLPGGGRAHGEPRPRRAARHPGCSQLRLAHRPRRGRRRGRGPELRGALDQRRSRSGPRRDVATRARGRRRLPGRVPRRADVPPGADARGAQRRRRSGRGALARR